MSIKDQLTPEQWKAVYSAPAAASAFVAMASGGGFDMFKEIAAAGKFISQGAAAGGDAGYGALVAELLSLMKDMSRDEAKAAAVQYQGSKDPAAVRGQIKQTVADAWAAVKDMPDADGFARWIVDVARAAALAKTGGHFGIGNKSMIDEQEQAALDDLANLMATLAG